MVTEIKDKNARKGDGDRAELAFEMRNVTFAYSGASEPVLKNASLSVKQGEFVGIIGPTGCGKSTLLYLLTGVIPHYYEGQMSGEVLCFGRPTKSQKMGELTAKVGFVMQDPEAQLFNLFVEDELVWGLECRGYERKEMDARITESLSRFNISQLRKRVTYDLSGGEKQKTTIAAIDAIRSEAIVFDKPTSEVDPLGANMIFEVVRKLAEERHTIVMVEDKVDQMVMYADRIVVVHGGEIRMDASVEEFCKRPDEVHQYGLRLPQVAELAHYVKKRGIALPRIPLTIEDAIKVFKEAMAGRGSAPRGLVGGLARG